MCKKFWIQSLLAIAVLFSLTATANARPRPGIAIKSPKMRVKMQHPEIAMELAKVEKELKATYTALRRAERRGCYECGLMAQDLKLALSEVAANWIAIDDGRVRSLSVRKGSPWWNKHILDLQKALGKPRLVLLKSGHRQAAKWLRTLKRAERRYAGLMPRIGRTINKKRSRARRGKPVFVVRTR